jgi:hypothetical protein
VREPRRTIGFAHEESPLAGWQDARSATIAIIWTASLLVVRWDQVAGRVHDERRR